MKRIWYNFPIIAMKVIATEGWGSFCWKTKQFIKYKVKKYPDIQKSRSEEILEVSAGKVEPLENSIKKYLKSRLLSFLTQYSCKLVFPKFEDPIVSIIILSNNQAEFTYHCLESILVHTDVPYEVILVDNGSIDETPSLFERLEGVVKIINKENTGFIKGSNQGASQAKGKYLMFLNNDTIVTPKWLTNLIKTIERSSMYGAVGCRLVSLNGKLQEAGSIIWNDGTAMGYGRGDNPFNPEYCYHREVDYCSGACLLVRRELFKRLEGFDGRYAPAYYEDSDLCMGIHELGYKVIFNPEVIIFHHEFTSIGSFEKARNLMESNRNKFVKKWEGRLKNKMTCSSNNILVARDLRHGERILFLDDRIPASNQGAGYPRAHHFLKCLNELGHKVTFFPTQNPTPWQPYTNELQKEGIEVFYGKTLDFHDFVKERSGFYEIVIISRYHNLQKNREIVKKFFQDAVLIYDSEALFSIREMIKAETMGNKLEKERCKQMVIEELNLMKEADIIITVSEDEKAKIINAGLDHVDIWGHSLTPKEIKSTFSKRKDILFVGGFLASQSPNEDAILYFAKQIFPKIQQVLDCKLFIVGINPPNSVKRLSSPSIVVTGYVEDVSEFYDRCRIFVVPHRYCSGIPYKLHEAMSYGIPSIVSGLIASQLNLKDRNETLIAKSAESFIESCIELYQNEKLWYEIQKNSLNLIKETCNPDVLKIKLNEIIKKAKNIKNKTVERLN